MKLTLGIHRSLAALALLGSTTLGCEKFVTCEQTKTCTEGDGGAGGEGSKFSSGGGNGTKPASGGAAASGGETSGSGGKSDGTGGKTSGSGGSTATSCEPGEYKSGDDCEACADGTFSSESDAEACVAWTVCVTGLEETKAGTNKSDRVCEVKEFVRRFGANTGVSTLGLHHTSGVTRVLANEAQASESEAFLRRFDLLGVEGDAVVGSVDGSVIGNGFVANDDGTLVWAGSANKNFAGTLVGSRDAWVRSYGASGTIVWQSQFGTSGNATEAFAVARDSTGNVYVAGSVHGDLATASAGNADVFVRKYSAAGVVGWTLQFGTAGNDEAAAIRVLANGEIVVAGTVAGGLPGVSGKGSQDWFVRRISAAGTVLGTTIVGTTMSESLAGMEIRLSDKLVLFGSTMGAFPGETRSGTGSDQDALVVVLNSSLAHEWAEQFGTASTDRATGVAFDESGNFLVAGVTFGALAGTTDLSGADYFVHKTDSSGEFIENRLVGTSSAETSDPAIAVDGQGGILVAGSTSGTFSGSSGTGNGVLLRLRP